MHITRTKIVVFLPSVLLLSGILSWAYYTFKASVHNIWSISIYAGANPFEFSPDPQVQQSPVLTSSQVVDVPARFVADPFMVFDQDTWYMFFEVLNTSTDQGDIGLASSPDGVNWQYKQIVLDEPFHLSYPYVFEWQESYYMIPESHLASAVRLYKAVEFPTKWTFIRELIVGNYSDPSIVLKDGKWWLFALKDQDSLTLHYAENLTGPWTEHPKSPIVKDDKNISKSGGRLIIFSDKIIRYTQDDYPTYGNAVRAFEVDEITTTTYREHELSQSPILRASGKGWNSIGMHTIDPHQIGENKWIACVDGKRREIVLDWKSGGQLLLHRLQVMVGKMPSFF